MNKIEKVAYGEKGLSNKKECDILIAVKIIVRKYQGEPGNVAADLSKLSMWIIICCLITLMKSSC